MDSLTGKTVIVCGGGKDESIGYGIACAFAREGANLVIVGASKHKVNGARELEEICGVRVLPLSIANQDEAAIRQAVERIVSEFGSIDVLVNCALLSKAAMLHEVSEHDLEECLHAGVVIPHLWMRSCLPCLGKSHGSVINFVSRSACAGMPALGALAAASEGLRALSAVAAAEWEPEGVQVEVVSARAQSSQLEKWASEFPEEYETCFAKEDLPSVDEVGAYCVSLVKQHVASLQ